MKLGPPEKYDPNNPEHNDPKKYKKFKGNVWDHVMSALKSNKIADPIVNLSILFHDLGKAITAGSKGGKPTYHGHAKAGKDLVDSIAKRLKLSNKEKEAILFAVVNHMKFHAFTSAGMKPSKIAKIVSDENWPVLKAVAYADEAARLHLFNPKEFQAVVDNFEEIKKKWGEKVINKTIKVVDGNRVMELLNLRPGPKVGEIIRKVTDDVLDAGIKDQGEIDNLILKYGSE